MLIHPELNRPLTPCCGVLAVARCQHAGITRPRTITTAELDQLWHQPTLAIYCPLCGRTTRPQ